MLIVDSQVHIWAPERPNHPWPPGAGPQRPSPFSAEDMLAEMAAAGVSAAVIVPPAWEGTRNDVALAAARRHPGRFAVMGRVRRNFRTEPHRSWLHDGSADLVWRQAESAGLSVMV